MNEMVTIGSQPTSPCWSPSLTSKPPNEAPAGSLTFLVLDFASDVDLGRNLRQQHHASLWPLSKIQGWSPQPTAWDLDLRLTPVHLPSDIPHPIYLIVLWPSLLDCCDHSEQQNCPEVNSLHKFCSSTSVQCVCDTHLSPIPCYQTIVRPFSTWTVSLCVLPPSS